MDDRAAKIRNGIFSSAQRTYGEKYMEPIIRFLYGLSPSNTAENDGVDQDGLFYEIKCSQVLAPNPLPITVGSNLYSKIMQENAASIEDRIVFFEDAYDVSFNCNIQNIKRDDFDVLLYVLLFADEIHVYSIDSEDIESEISNWCGKHGRYDEEGKSGQFSINNRNLADHEERFLIDVFTWEDITDDIYHSGDKMV